MTRRPVAPEETSSSATLNEAKGLGMDPHNHRDASLALSVTCAMFLRSAAKGLGAVDYARMTIAAVQTVPIHEDYAWGLDHGAWCVLKPMFPTATIPIFQLGLDVQQPAAYHYALAQQLAFLRRRGVLIVGSGNVVHNLRMLQRDGRVYDWAVEFDTMVKERLEAHDDQALIAYEQFGQAARLAVPTNDHYLPLLYTLGLRDPQDTLAFFNDQFDLGSLSMRSVILAS